MSANPSSSTIDDSNSLYYATEPTKSNFWQTIMLPVIIWSLSAFFYFYDNFIQVSPSVMKPELSLAFNISAEQFGALSAFFLWAYGVMQIPVGLLADKYGPRKLLIAASAFAAIGCLVFAGADNLFQAKIARMMMGVGAGFAVVCCLKLASIWFKPNKFAFLTGLMVTAGFLAPAANYNFSPAILTKIDWRLFSQISGYIGLGIFLLIILLVKDKSNNISKSENNSAQQQCSNNLSFSSLITGLVKIICSPQVWFASIYAGLMFVPTIAFGGLWGVPFLTEAYNMDRELAGEIIAWIYVGWIFGAPFFGWFSDFLGKRNVPMYIASAATLILSLALIYITGLSPLALRIILFLLGFFSSGFILAFALVREINSPILAGSVVGFINALNTFFGAVSQQLIGKILDWNVDKSLTSAGTNINQVFTLADYQHALLSMPICLLLALGLLTLIKETNCKQVQ